MEHETTFRIKSYTWKELGLQYSPNESPISARKRLRRWVDHHPTLRDELTRLGWKKGNHLLTPSQVKLIIHHLGEPFHW
ncbi:MAG: DUF4248 domain-containing protein [Tannerellaceae bacterium]|nr:DUF4248 domain-containing protein [Tannerellaceae bacterium]